MLSKQNISCKIEESCFLKKIFQILNIATSLKDHFNDVKNHLQFYKSTFAQKINH